MTCVDRKARQVHGQDVPGGVVVYRVRLYRQSLVWRLHFWPVPVVINTRGGLRTFIGGAMHGTTLNLEIAFLGLHESNNGIQKVPQNKAENSKLSPVAIVVQSLA